MVKAPERLHPPGTGAPEPQPVSRRKFLKRGLAIGAGVAVVAGSGVGAVTLLGSEGSPKRHRPTGGSHETPTTTIPEKTPQSELEKNIERFFTQTREEFELKMSQNVFYTVGGDLDFPFAILDNGIQRYVERYVEPRPTLSWVEMRSGNRNSFNILATPLGVMEVPLTDSGGVASVMVIGEVYPQEYGDRALSYVLVHVDDQKNELLNALPDPFLTTKPVVGTIQGAGRYPVDHTNLEYADVTKQVFFETIKKNIGSPIMLDLSNIPMEYWNPDLPPLVSDTVADFYGNSQNIINKDPQAFLQTLQTAEQRGLAIVNPQTKLPKWFKGVRNLDELTQYAAIANDILVFESSSKIV